MRVPPQALRAARAQKGANGGKLSDECDVYLRAPATSTPRIQEMHIMIGHIICRLVEGTLC